LKFSMTEQEKGDLYIQVAV